MKVWNCMTANRQALTPDYAAGTSALTATGKYCAVHRRVKSSGARGWGVMLFTVAALLPAAAEAHAIVGMRLFPATLSFDDPGVAAELPLNFSSINTGNGVQDTFSMAYAQLLTRKFGLVVSGNYQQLVPQIGPSQSGWDNFTVAAAYQLYKNDSLPIIGATIPLCPLKLGMQLRIFPKSCRRLSNYAMLFLLRPTVKIYSQSRRKETHFSRGRNCDTLIY